MFDPKERSAVPGSALGKAPVSVLIPTKDEELNLPSTLETLSWADQVVVFDSFSTDGTRDIARKFDCDFYQRKFDNFSAHKNWALDHVEFRHQWILILDADEKVSPELAQEICEICARPSDFAAYNIARQIWVDGVWLKYAGKYPDYNIRLLKKGKARYETRIVHEHMVVDGRAGFLKHHIVHVDRKGTQRYIERHNRYAEMEAVEAYIAILAGRNGNRRSSPEGLHFFRRRYLKTFAYQRLVFRPVFVFLYMYFFKLGFLMGGAGVKVCVLRMFYEYMINLYLDELRDPQSPVYLKYQAYIEERCNQA